MPQIPIEQQNTLVDLLLELLPELAQMDRALRTQKLRPANNYSNAQGDTLPAIYMQVVSSFNKSWKIPVFLEAVLQSDVLKGEAPPPLQNWIEINRGNLQREEPDILPRPDSPGTDSKLIMNVARFHKHIEERQESFDFLWGNKMLHELLHQIPDWRELLIPPIEEVKRSGKTPKSAAAVMKQVHRCLDQAEQNLHKVENREEHQEWMQELGTTVDDLEKWFDLMPTLEALLSDGATVLDQATNHVPSCRASLGILLGSLKHSGEMPGSMGQALQLLASQVTAARSTAPASSNRTAYDLWLEQLDNCVAEAQKCWSVRPSAADPRK